MVLLHPYDPIYKKTQKRSSTWYYLNAELDMAWIDLQLTLSGIVMRSDIGKALHLDIFKSSVIMAEYKRNFGGSYYRAMEGLIGPGKYYDRCLHRRAYRIIKYVPEPMEKPYPK